MARTGRRWAAHAAALVALAALLAAVLLARGLRPRAAGGPRPAGAFAAGERRVERDASVLEDAGPRALALGLAEASPSAGWEEAAEAVAADLRRVLEGRPGAGAYAEARAEASRADLALFPPDGVRLRRLLAGGARERILALAALAARPELDDDLARLVLLGQRPEDDEVARLLGAEIAAGLAPDLVARHEDELLRAFEREPNPLVLAVALPALERMEAPRLRALLRAQAAAADPEMLPVLLALSRTRLGRDGAADVEASPGSGVAAR